MTEDDEWEAEIFTDQAREWMDRCVMAERCPAAKLYKHLITQQIKIRKLEHYIKIIEDQGR